jgi:hypothetical protein
MTALQYCHNQLALMIGPRLAQVLPGEPDKTGTIF